MTTVTNITDETLHRTTRLVMHMCRRVTTRVIHSLLLAVCVCQMVLGTESSDLVAEEPEASVLGDPVFTGLRGQKFQIHGVDGEYYGMLSTPVLHLNAQFAFLDSGECPPEQTEGCWSQPGTYVGAIGLQMRVPLAENDANRTAATTKDLLFQRLTPRAMEAAAAASPDDTTSALHPGMYTMVQRLLLKSGAARVGFSRVELNGVSMSVGDLFSLPYPITPELERLHEATNQSSSTTTGNVYAKHHHCYVHLVSRWKVLVHTSDLSFSFESSDGFINHRVRFVSRAVRDAYESGRAPMHGLLGQTVLDREWLGQKLRFTEGGDVDAYVVSHPSSDEAPPDPDTVNSDALFSATFAYTRFHTDEQLDEMEAHQGEGDEDVLVVDSPTAALAAVLDEARQQMLSGQVSVPNDVPNAWSEDTVSLLAEEEAPVTASRLQVAEEVPSYGLPPATGHVNIYHDTDSHASPARTDINTAAEHEEAIISFGRRRR